jgi:hypothetical protein
VKKKKILTEVRDSSRNCDIIIIDYQSIGDNYQSISLHFIRSTSLIVRGSPNNFQKVPHCRLLRSKMDSLHPAGQLVLLALERASAIAAEAHNPSAQHCFPLLWEKIAAALAARKAPSASAEKLCWVKTFFIVVKFKVHRPIALATRVCSTHSL